MSPLWTSDLREELMPHGDDEGLFWISFEDMMLYVFEYKLHLYIHVILF